eukprot:9298358-Pyramimonas_sp.AAC.1
MRGLLYNTTGGGGYRVGAPRPPPPGCVAAVPPGGVGGGWGAAAPQVQRRPHPLPLLFRCGGRNIWAHSNTSAFRGSHGCQYRCIRTIALTIRIIALTIRTIALTIRTKALNIRADDNASVLARAHEAYTTDVRDVGLDTDIWRP